MGTQQNGPHFFNGPPAINPTDYHTSASHCFRKKPNGDGAGAIPSFSPPGFAPPRRSSLRCSSRRLEPDRGREEPSRARDREVRGGGAQQVDRDEAEVPERDKGPDSGRRRHQLPANGDGQERRRIEEVRGGCLGEAGWHQAAHFLSTRLKASKECGL